MKTSKNRGTYYSPFTDMRIIGRIVGVQRTEQSVGIIVGAFDPNIIYCYNIFVILIHQVIAYIK